MNKPNYNQLATLALLSAILAPPTKEEVGNAIEEAEATLQKIETVVNTGVILYACKPCLCKALILIDLCSIGMELCEILAELKAQYVLMTIKELVTETSAKYSVPKNDVPSEWLTPEHNLDLDADILRAFGFDNEEIGAVSADTAV